MVLFSRSRSDVWKTVSYLSIGVMVCSTHSALAAPPLKPAWKFLAFAAPYGRFRTTTTSDTAMVDNGVFRYSINGPDFESFRIYNPENKSYIETTITQYARQWAPSPRYPALEKIGKGKILNLECDHYLGEFKRSGTAVDAWFTTALPLDKNLTDSFSRVCGLPGGYGLPVKVRFRNSSGTMLMYEMLKIEPQKIALESLLVPKAYRLMKDQALFFLSDADGSNTGVDEFFRSIPMRKNGKK
ncbi:MAG: DUF4412 domain-containing protein [Cyanobacteria bacterium]|nr:DUF4412 domain-containing protein [Cyanobacteriota bacterium]